MRQSTQEIYPGPPTTLYVDKIGSDSVKKELEPFTTYTVSVSTCNDNKKCGENSTLQVKFNTKMSKTAKQLLQALTFPFIAGPFVLGNSQSPDENMDESDEEYPASSGVYPCRSS